MTTGTYFLLAGIITAVAFWRRPGVTSAILMAGLAASFASPWSRMELLPYLSTIDVAVVVAMTGIWAHDRHNMRAWTIGFIGLAKCAWTWFAAVNVLQVNTYGYVLPLNCAYLAQVLVAGGFADGIGHRLDDLFRRVVPRRYGLLRNGGR